MIISCLEWRSKFGIYWNDTFRLFKTKIFHEQYDVPNSDREAIINYVRNASYMDKEFVVEEEHFIIYFTYSYLNEHSINCLILNMWYLPMTEQEIKKYLAFV